MILCALFAMGIQYELDLFGKMTVKLKGIG